MVGVQEKAIVDDILNYYNTLFPTFKTRTHKGQHRHDGCNSMDHEGTIHVRVTGAICSCYAQLVVAVEMICGLLLVRCF
jgi:hypothetical protein